MNAIFSLHKKYADLILSGEKTMEFRNRKTKLKDGDKVYIYETKKNGCGKIVGYFICGETIEIPKHKVGTYNFLLKYAKKNCSKEDIEAIEKAMTIDLINYDNSLVLDYVFDDEIISYMQKYKEPPDFETNYSIFYNNHHRYVENDTKRKKLYDDVDKWLRKIGYYNEYDETYWKYYIEIKAYKKFDEPLSINNFQLCDGKTIEKAPQSYCYTKTNL